MATKTFNVPCQSDCLLDIPFCTPCDADSPGGLSQIWLIPVCELESTEDTDTDGIIDTITLKGSSNGWYTVQAVVDTGSFTQTYVSASNTFNQVFTFELMAKSFGSDDDEQYANARAFVEKLANNTQGFAVIVQLNNGVRVMLGETNRGLRATDTTAMNSGTDPLADRAGYTIEMSGPSRTARVVANTITLPEVNCDPY